MQKKKSILIIFTLMLVSFSGNNMVLSEDDVQEKMENKQESEVQNSEENRLKMPISLEEATELMLKDNATLKLAELGLEKAKVSADDLREDADDNIEDNDSYKYLQGVTIPKKTADFKTSMAEKNIIATKEKLKAELEQSYYQLLQAQESMKINKDALDIAQEAFAQTQQKFELGLVAKQQVLNAELNVIQTKNSYESSLNSVKKARMALNQTLGLDITNNTQLEDTLSPVEMEEVQIEEAVEKALTNRNEVKAAQFKHDIQKLNFEVADRSMSEIRFEYRQQEAVFAEAKENLENTKRQIEMEVRSNYLDIMQSKKEIEEKEKAVDLAEESLRISQISYKNGLNVFTDVQKAQRTLSQAKLGLSQAILDYNLAVHKFKDSIQEGRTTINLQ